MRQNLLRHLPDVSIDIGVRCNEDSTNGAENALIGYSKAEGSKKDISLCSTGQQHLLEVEVAELDYYPLDLRGRVDQHHVCYSAWRWFPDGIVGEKRLSEGTTPWFSDDREAIQSTSKLGFRGWTKHAHVKFRCAREHIEERLVDMEFVPSYEGLCGYSVGTFVQLLSRGMRAQEGNVAAELTGECATNGKDFLE